jgi:hypothetical protein
MAEETQRRRDAETKGQGYLGAEGYRSVGARSDRLPVAHPALSLKDATDDHLRIKRSRYSLQIASPPNGLTGGVKARHWVIDTLIYSKWMSFLKCTQQDCPQNQHQPENGTRNLALVTTIAKDANQGLTFPPESKEVKADSKTSAQRTSHHVIIAPK